MTLKERKARLIIDLTEYLQTCKEIDLDIIDIIIWNNRISSNMGYKILAQLTTNN